MTRPGPGHSEGVPEAAQPGPAVLLPATWQIAVFARPLVEGLPLEGDGALPNLALSSREPKLHGARPWLGRRGAARGGKEGLLACAI